MVDLKKIGINKLKSLNGVWTEITKQFKDDTILFSIGSMGTCYFLTDEMIDKIKMIESRSNCKVIHVVSGKYNIDGEVLEMDSYITVTESDFENETSIIDGTYELFNYTFNKSYGEGEFGYSLFKPTVAGGLKRVA